MYTPPATTSPTSSMTERAMPDNHSMSCLKITLIALGVILSLAIIPGVMGIVGLHVVSAPAFMYVIGSHLTLYGSCALTGVGVFTLTLLGIFAIKSCCCFFKKQKTASHAVSVPEATLPSERPEDTLPALDKNTMKALLGKLEKETKSVYVIFKLAEDVFIEQYLDLEDGKESTFHRVFHKNDIIIAWTKKDIKHRFSVGFRIDQLIQYDLQPAFPEGLPKRVFPEDYGL